MSLNRAEKLEAVVKLAVKCDDQKRNVMEFGLEESSAEKLMAFFGTSVRWTSVQKATVFVWVQ